MRLYSSMKRMVAMFSTAIVFSTLLILGLRLTVFSDMATANPADSSENMASLQSSEIEGGSGFPYRLNSKIYFAKPDSEGNVLILNPATNEQYLRINILLPETKQSLYYTGIIAPGTSIDSAELSAAGKQLQPGVYECIAEISAIDPETRTRLVSEEKPVSIYIGVKP